MIQNVILDVDGTLVDSVDFHAEAWQRAFEKFGKTVEKQAVRDQIGKGGDQLMPVFLSESEIAEFGDELEKYRGELFKSDYLPRVQALPEARMLVARLVADGKRVVLASSANPDELEHFKQLVDIEHLLEGSTDADDVEKSKPFPDVFVAALAELGNPAPEDTIVIGDSPYDAQAAGKINLQTIGLLSGGFDREWLEAEGCVEIYDNPAQLLENYEDSVLCCEVKKVTAPLAKLVGNLLT